MLSQEELENILMQVSSIQDEKVKILATQALKEEKVHRKAIEAELAVFMKKISENFLDLSEVEKEMALQKIKEKFRTDTDFIEQLNNSLKPYNAGTDVTFSLKTNKMTEILAGAEDIVKKYFNQLTKGESELPQEYNFRTSENEITILGEEAATHFYQKPAFYGNSKSTFFSAAVLSAYLQTTNLTYISEIPALDELNRDGKKWIDQSAIAHVASIPSNLNIHTTSTYLYKDEITPKGLTFIHSGYAFGGQRGETRYSEGKLLGPEDCSSWVAKITNCEDKNLTTKDMMNTYRYGVEEEEHSDLKPWEETPVGKAAVNSYEPVKIRDPQRDIKPGQLWCCRFFKTVNEKKTETGGHTGMVLGVRSNGETVALSYSRDMPEMEGFGLGVYPSNDVAKDSGEGTKVSFFNLR